MGDYRRSRAGRRQSWYGLKRHVKRACSLPIVHPVLRMLAPRIPSIRVGRLPAPAGLREVVGLAGGARYVMLAPDRCEIAKELYWGGGLRPDTRDAFALDLVATFARGADFFLDVGAYTGVFTLATTAAEPGIRAVAFEIVPAVAEALQDNIERNGVSDRVDVRQLGVGDPSTTMLVPTGAGGSALPSFYSSSMRFDDGVTVRFTALDSLLDEVDGSVVMKIDVEGGEGDVLRHGQSFLARHRPDILCEILACVADGEDLEGLLAPHGFRFYLVREADLRPCPHIVPDDHYRDWVLTPRGPEQLASLGIPVAEP